MVFVLVHSPLVGPSSWSAVAAEMQRRGHQVVVPSLLGPDGTPPRHWRECVAAAREETRALSEPIVLAGHSRGGSLLPMIAASVALPVSRLIFVDSRLPAGAGRPPAGPPPLPGRIRRLAVDGRLPPWSSWWGEDAMRDLVPDERLRAALVREMPSLPLACVAQSIPGPGGWERTPCSYLLLSDAYREGANEASERGWRVEEIAGARHLHIAVAPRAVAEALLRLSAG